MTLKLPKDLFEWTINHTCKNGDTDIFPFPFELQFLSDATSEISEELSKLDLSQYKPLSILEALVPKSRYGFRVAHQLYPIDHIVFTALVFSVSNEIEKKRLPKSTVFSYRYMPNDEYSVFDGGSRYKDWMNHLANSAFFNDEHSFVIRTDISDFYHRIYRHRLENIIDTLTENPKIRLQIERFIKEWRGRQSFGIPVGNNACRILAEAAFDRY